MEVVLKHVFWSKFKGIYLTNHPLPGDKPFCTVRRLMCWLEILLLIPGELMFISGRISSNNLASSDECLYTVGRTCTSLWPCLSCLHFAYSSKSPLHPPFLEALHSPSKRGSHYVYFFLCFPCPPATRPGQVPQRWWRTWPSAVDLLDMGGA
jgi:hypothetical protein